MYFVLVFYKLVVFAGSATSYDSLYSGGGRDFEVLSERGTASTISVGLQFLTENTRMPQELYFYIAVMTAFNTAAIDE